MSNKNSKFQRGLEFIVHSTMNAHEEQLCKWEHISMYLSIDLIRVQGESC